MILLKQKVKIYKDRFEAGRLLAKKLAEYKKYCPIILSIPRGGVILGYEVSKALKARHQVVIAKKISHPLHPEYGIGAISEDLEPYFDFTNFGKAHFNVSLLTEQIIDNQKEIKNRIKKFRNGKKLDLKNQVTIVVDDGLATGVTAIAGLRYLNKLHPKKLIFAAPVCACKSIGNITPYVTKAICLQSPKNLHSVGFFYRDFSQVSDKEVLNILRM